MNIVFAFLVYLVPFVIKKDYAFFNTLNLNYYLPFKVFYVVGFLDVLFISILITRLINKLKFDNSFLFNFSLLWIFRIFCSIYFNFFNSIIFSLIFIVLDLLNLVYIFYKIKKINITYCKYLFLGFFIDVYLIFLFVQSF